MARGTKSENKAVPEKVKPVKELSSKRQTEADHLAGKHLSKNDSTEQIKSISLNNPECGYCARRVIRNLKRGKH